MFRFMCRCFIALLACSVTISATFASYPQQSTSVVVDLINQFRNVNGLSSLRINNALTTAAQVQANHMSSVAFVSHFDANGNRADTRAATAGYGGRVTELIFGSSGDEARAVEWWQNSDLHRSLLLSNRYVEIGVGASFNADDGWVYWAVVLGDGQGGVAEPQTSTSDSESAPVDVDPAVLLPTATAVNTPIPVPTNTPVPIPTVTPLPTMGSMAVSPTAESVDAVVVEPTAALPDPTTAVAIAPTVQAVAVQSSDTSSPDTIASVDTEFPQSVSPLSEEAEPPNWFVFVALALSMFAAPLLIYFWLGRYTKSAE